MAEDKYREAINRSAVTVDDAFVTAEVKRILDENLEKNSNEEVYKFLFNCIDLTTLQATDSPRSVADFTEKVNQFETEHPEMPNVAAICVYPNFAQVVRAVLEVSEVEIACVSGPFPVVGIGSEFTDGRGRGSHHTHIGIYLLCEHIVPVTPVERFYDNSRSRIVFQKFFSHAFFCQ